LARQAGAGHRQLTGLTGLTGLTDVKGSRVDLPEAMRTQNACRYYRDDPVPDEVLYQAVELARFAPNGGNRCAVRFDTERTMSDGDRGPGP
jgi:Nitroreductase family